MYQIKSALASTATVASQSVEILPKLSVTRRGIFWVSNTHATNLVYLALDEAAVAGHGIFVAPRTTVAVEGWNGSVKARASASGTVLAIEQGFLDQYVAGDAGA